MYIVYARSTPPPPRLSVLVCVPRLRVPVRVSDSSLPAVHICVWCH